MPLSLRNYHTQAARIRAAVSAQVVGYWSTLGNYRDSDVDRFVRVVVPKIQAGQIATARATASFLGGKVLPRDQIIASRKVSQAVEYRRPAVSLYTALSNGLAFTDAVTSGTQRLESLISTDMQLALVVQSQASLRSVGATRFRRVLTGSENCPLCQIASTNIYSTNDLLPIHDKCDCTVEPIFDDYTPPQLSASDLALSSIRETEVQDGASPESLIAVRDHGEIGPVLAWASDQFTGPDEIHIVTDGVHK